MPEAVSIGKRMFWRAYFKIYDRLCDIKPYQKLIGRGVELLDVRGGGKYLDAASGTGNSTAAVWRKLQSLGGGRVRGIDTSTFGLEISEKKFPSQKFPGLKFAFGDIDQRLPYVDATFDGVFSNNAMYLAKDPLDTLREIYRVLKPRARFVMSNPKPKASPLAIILEDARMRFYEALGDHSRITAGILSVCRFGKKFFVLLSFLPFQIALKSGAGGASNFISEAQWRRIINDLALEGSAFEIVSVEDAYAGQNTLFAMVKY